MVKDKNTKIQVENISFSYGSHRILNNVSVDIKEKSITAVIGPSGQGKSTMNRLWEHLPQARMEGKVQMLLKNRLIDIYAPSVSLPDLRRSVCMIDLKLK